VTPLLWCFDRPYRPAEEILEEHGNQCLVCRLRSRSKCTHFLGLLRKQNRAFIMARFVALGD
jgi:hypothetical protein